MRLNARASDLLRPTQIYRLKLRSASAKRYLTSSQNIHQENQTKKRRIVLESLADRFKDIEEPTEKKPTDSTDDILAKIKNVSPGFFAFSYETHPRV